MPKKETSREQRKLNFKLDSVSAGNDIVFSEIGGMINKKQNVHNKSR